MKIGKVIGNVVSSVKDPGLNSLRLLIVQGLDDNLEPNGDPYVAADGILTAGPGDIVYLVSKKEAALVFPEELVPIDECIAGFIEEHFVTKQAKRKTRKKKTPPTLDTKEPPSAKLSKPPKKIISPSSEPIKKTRISKPVKTPAKTDSPVISKEQTQEARVVKKKTPQGVSRKTKTPSQRRKSQ